MPTSCNIAQHGVQMNATCCAQHVGTTCWAQHVSATTFVCTPCCARLHDVGICCVQFETSQTFCPTYANISFVRVIDEAYHNMLCSFHDSHNVVGLGRAHCE